MILLQIIDTSPKICVANLKPFANESEFNVAYREAVMSKNVHTVRIALYRGAMSGFVHISCPSTDSLI